MRVIVIHNAKAGDGRHDGESIEALIRSAGHEPRLVPTSDENWPDTLDEPADLIVAAGGDGTVGKVGRQLARTGRSMAILPLGTANNIACSLGLAGRSFEELVHGWSEALLKPFDTGLAIGPWGRFRFLESAGAGALFETIRRAEKRPGRDPVALYQENLEEDTGFWVTLAIDEVDRSGDYLLVEAMNTPGAGPNLALAPRADTGDGLLDFVGREAPNDAEEGGASSDGDEVPPRTWRGRAARLVFQGRGVHLDDTIWMPDDGRAIEIAMEVRVEPGALQLLLPR